MTRVAVLLAAASEVPQGEGWLDPREARVLAGLRVPKRREEWLLGRWTAKRAVSTFLAEAPGALAAPVGSVAILAASDGAPEAWIGRDRAPCAISISHRAGRACCAVGGPDLELGCDLELVEPRSEGFVGEYLTAAEADFVRGASPAERDLVANLVWSAKESVLKAVRVGLRADARSVRVVAMGPRPSVGGWSSFEAEAEERWAGWWSVRGGFVLTVVSRPPSTVYSDPTTSSTSSP
jgi:4'-phosphopantetheinyl transferase